MSAIFVSASATLFLLVFFVHLYATRHIPQQREWPHIFGDREDAVLGLWSLQHTASGIILGSLMASIGLLQKMGPVNFFTTIFLLALSWEATELSMEEGWFGKAVDRWLKGNEHWAKRFFADIPLVVAGSMFGSKFESLWWIMLIPATLWLIINVASPHSMFIQESLFRLFRRR